MQCMKYTINSNHFHSHIISKIKELIIKSNVCFKISACGREGYHDDDEENEMEEDLGIENINTVSVSLNSCKRNSSWKINWI